MNFSFDGRSIHVYLSRRNLLALLTKMDHPESMRTIGMEGDGLDLWVTAEEDEAHYGARVPGLMHPFTESDILVQRTVSQNLQSEPQPGIESVCRPIGG